MTYIKIIILSLFVLQSCRQSSSTVNHEELFNFETAAEAGQKKDIPAISFQETEYNFGTVVEGEKVEHDFVFTNTGKGNLYILDTQSSCGCTVTDYKKEAIKPGEKSQIKLVFDTAGKKDEQDKKVTIFTNTIPNKYNLILTGQVVQK